MCIAFLFNMLLFKFTGKREKLMEVLFALLFCKSPWVNKDTGEIISSILSGRQAKIPSVFLGGDHGSYAPLNCVLL